MDRTDSLTMPSTAWMADYLQDISPRRLVLEHYDHESVALRRYLLFLGLDPDTAQEIVQESFLKLLQHLLTGGDRTNLRAWLYRVAHNLARNEQTAFRTAKTDSLSAVNIAGDVPSSAASIEEELLGGALRAERATRLRDAIGRLTPAQKDCLLLRAQGFKYREIAGVLSLSVSTVGENIQRGLQKLKEIL